ncbi:hypothetical protein ABZY07_45705, partial [Streptomyces tauricus]
MVRPTRTTGRHRTGSLPRRPAREGAPVTPHQPQLPCWPKALRAVRSWLTPAITLTRWRRAWTDQDPPPELQALLDTVTASRPLDLYRRV